MKPLAGKRIVLTRGRGQNEEFGAALRALGAEITECPAIRIAPPEDWREIDAGLVALRANPAGATAIFTSANAARTVLGRLTELGLDAADLNGARIVAIGAATARALRQARVRVDLVPAISSAEGLIGELEVAPGGLVFLPQADIARPVLRDSLRARGATVFAATAYHTVPDQQIAELAAILGQSRIDAITFTSSSTVRYALEGLAGAGIADGAALINRAAVASIGPQTSATARELGLRVDLEAEEHTTEGLARALADFWRR